MEGEAEVVEGVEGLNPQDLLLEGPDESLCDAVALGLGDEGGAGADAEESELALEVVVHVLRAVVVAQREAVSHVLVVAPEVDPDALS